MGAAGRDLTADEIRFLEAHSGLPAEVWSASKPDAESVQRAEAVRLADYYEHNTLSVDEAAKRLGVEPAQVSQWLAHGDVAAWRFGEEVRLPRWQFTPDGLLPHLVEVLAVLPADLPPVTVLGFVTTPQDDLDGQTVIDWLAAGGDVAAVAFAASALDSW